MIKDCLSYPGYMVSDAGIVYSKHRNLKPLSARPDRKGYLRTGIRRNGKQLCVGIHQLVADAFHGPAPFGMEVRHLDGDNSNNHPDNLAYGTKVQNAFDRLMHGGYARGESHPNAKLTDAEAMQLRDLRGQGKKVRELASMFSISVASVESIIYGKSYRAITFKQIEAAESAA